MHTKLLIDNIVRQTTILIAELSTAAGVRAPLSHIADQVFVDLARAIEAQGVGRKVVADMFGLALRTYQKRVQRLEEGATVRDKTLWEAVLDFLRDNGGATRTRLFERFKRDEEKDVAAVLNDLVSSGLVYVSGRGNQALYGLTPDDDRQRMAHANDAAALSGLLWMAIYRQQGGASEDELAEALGVARDAIDEPLGELQGEGRITQGDDGRWRAATVTIAVGAQVGWEAAVFDHYQAVATCVRECVDAGGEPRTCYERCAAAADPVPPQDDRTCVRMCLDEGGEERACVERCTASDRVDDDRTCVRRCVDAGGEERARVERCADTDRASDIGRFLVSTFSFVQPRPVASTASASLAGRNQPAVGESRAMTFSGTRPRRLRWGKRPTGTVVISAPVA